MHWVRDSELDCLSVDLHWFPQNLLMFQSLCRVEINFAPEGLNTQEDRVNQLFKYLPSRLSHLKLTYLPRIDVSMLYHIASLFPQLLALVLTCTERITEDCCWYCYEEASGCTAHSPLPDAYSDVDDLTVSLVAHSASHLFWRKDAHILTY